MALSNIFREPRREITETAMGLIPFGAAAILMVVNYYVSCWLVGGKNVKGSDVGFCMFLLTAATIIIGFIVVFVHWAGEEVCDFLEKRGIQIRPRQRYR